MSKSCRGCYYDGMQRLPEWDTMYCPGCVRSPIYGQDGHPMMGKDNYSEKCRDTGLSRAEKEAERQKREDDWKAYYEKKFGRKPLLEGDRF